MLKIPRSRTNMAPRAANMFLATSAAALMIAAEPNALALDFTDTFFASLGRYGAASVKDMTTPGNNFEGVPDDLLSFTGTTKLTRSADGVLRYRAHNLALQSEDFSNAVWIKTRATVSADVSAAPSGGVTADKLAEDTAVSNSHLVSQTNITVVAGAPYVHRVRVKAAGRTWVALAETMSDAGGSSRQTFFNLGAGAVGSTNAAHAPAIVPLGDGWYDCSILFTSGVSGTTRAIQVTLASSDGTVTYTGDGVSGVYLWGAHFRKSPADSTYIPTTTAAKFGLPYEWGVNLTDGTNNSQTVTVRSTTSAYSKTTYLVSYDGAGSVALSGGATGAVTSGTPFYLTSSTTSLVLTVTGSISNLQVREFLGILVEPQATNSCVRSTDFSNATWQNSAPNIPTVAGGSSNGPRGPSTMTTLTAATGGVSCQVQQVTTLSGSTQYCFSLYVKQGTAASSRILVRDDTNGVNFLQATALTWSGGVPSIGGITGTWATPVHIGDGVYRISGYGTTGAGASISAWVSIFPDNAAGTGSLLVDLAQLETGAVATSPIITYGASAVRAGDSPQIATALFPMSAVNATVFVQYNKRVGVAGSSGNVIFELSAANRADALTQVYVGAGGSNAVNIADRGAAYAVQAFAGFTTTDGVDHRIAMTSKTNDFAYTADGAAPVLDTAGTYQASPFTTLKLGFGAGGDQLNGHLKKFMCIPRHMPAQIQAITT